MKDSSSFEKSSATVTQGQNPVKQDSAKPSPAHKSGKRHLVKAAGVVGLMTLTSRILGMTRDIVTANRFGTSWQWDAFLYAFMLPNFFRRLVGEGALSSAFIPVYTETLEQKGKAEAFRFANVMATVLSAGLVVFMLVVEAILQVLLRLQLSDRLHLTVDLLQTFFPYLFFISLFALAMGILNCHQHFFTPALGPIIMDLAWIAAMIWVLPRVGSVPEVQLHWLAAILLVSGAVQFAVDIPPLYKMGFRFRWTWDFVHPGLAKTGRLLIPAIMGFAITQLNILVDASVAYFIGPGANSSLWYGTRLMQFPLGVFGIAMGTALLPMLSQQVARKEKEAAKKTLSFALRSLALILLPCMMGLIVLRVPIVKMLFERGEFDAVSTARTASVLMFYALGLFFYAGEKIVAAGFFATQDTKTPVILGVVSLLINIVLNLSLMRFMAESGLALATSIASLAEFFLLVRIYRRKISDFNVPEVVRSCTKIMLASSVMGILCTVCFRHLEAVLPGSSTHAQMVRVFGSILFSAVVYVAACFLFRVSEMREAFQFLRSRKAKA